MTLIRHDSAGGLKPAIVGILCRTIDELLARRWLQATIGLVHNQGHPYVEPGLTLVVDNDRCARIAHRNCHVQAGSHNRASHLRDPDQSTRKAIGVTVLNDRWRYPLGKPDFQAVSPRIMSFSLRLKVKRFWTSGSRYSRTRSAREGSTLHPESGKMPRTVRPMRRGRGIYCRCANDAVLLLQERTDAEG